MATRNDFVEHVVELMQGLGPVQAKPMFGGWGVFLEGLCFGIIAADALYLKGDAVNAARFDAERLEAFIYQSKIGESITTSYRQVPAEALDNAMVMVGWAREGYEAALRAAQSRPPGKPRRRSAA
jgi:DNA transformation protein